MSVKRLLPTAGTLNTGGL